MSLQKIPLILSVAILAVAGIVVTLVTAQSGTTINTTPHVISNVTATDITQTTATIRWQTEEPASSTVYFYVNGTMVDLASQYLDRTTTHAVTIYGRLPGTTYHYRVMSGNTDVYFDPTAPSRKAISDSPDQFFTTTTLSSSASSVSSASSATVASCMTNADCGGIVWIGATWCGSSGNGLYNNLMQLSTGFCDTSNGLCAGGYTGHVKEDCAASGQICANVDHTPRCTAPQLPPTCSINTPITAPCRCGSNIVPDIDSYGYCCGTSWVLNGCPISGPLAPPSSSSSTPLTASQAIIVPTPPSGPTPSTPVSTPTDTPAVPSSPLTPPVPSIQHSAAPLVTAPKLSPNILKAQTGSTVEKTLRKLSPKDVKKWQLDLRRELRKFERFLLKQGKTAFVSQVGDIREELYDLDPDDPLAGKAIQNLQEELAELRLIADAVPLSSSARIAVAPTASSQPVVTPKVPAVPLFSKETSIAITYPSEGSTLRGFTHIDVAMQNASEASGLQFQVDGVNIGGDENGKIPYGRIWLTRSVVNGTHELRVMAWDAQGNTVTSSPVHVTVQNMPDSVPPTMSVPKVTAVTRTTATIRWTTDEPVGTSLSYFDMLSYSVYGKNHGLIRNYRGRRTQHEVTLTDLKPGTTYSYSVAVDDDAGNVSVGRGYEGTYTDIYDYFTTLSDSPLAIFNIRIKDITQASATFTWTTSVPAHAELRWTDSAPPVRSTAFTTEHVFTLTDLKPFAYYNFRIRSEDALGNTVQIPPPKMDYRSMYFQTKEIPDEVAEITTNVHRWKIDADGNFTERADWSLKDYPGARSYFTITVKDDRPLHAVKVSLQGKRKTYWELTLPQCSGKTSCEDRNHSFTIPEDLGTHWVHFDVEEDSPYRPGTVGRRSYGSPRALTVVPCPYAKCE